MMATVIVYIHIDARQARPSEGKPNAISSSLHRGLGVNSWRNFHHYVFGTRNSGHNPNLHRQCNLGNWCPDFCR